MSQTPLLEPQTLPRGGLVVVTSRGPVQFGVPPETIKDSMQRDHGVPGLYVLMRDFFSYERGISFAEMEFPIYFNFFVCKRRVKVVGTADQRRRLNIFMQESMFGPAEIDLSREIAGDPESILWYPSLDKEIEHFKRHPFEPDRRMSLEDVIDFHVLPEEVGVVTIDGLTLSREGTDLILVDPEHPATPVSIPGDIRLPPRIPDPENKLRPFEPPDFAVTVLGSGHGFDPNGKTTGFVLWIGGRGILVDPPVDATEWLREREVPHRCIDAIILTHCHGDHDAGTLQKALQADRVRLHTTHTIHESFLRKSEAITNLEQARFSAILDFRPVPIGRDLHLNGARFRFFYTLHSIPTIGFEVWFRNKSMVYTADTLNDPEQIRALETAGIMTAGRATALLAFPWHHDLVIHEAGVPPLHTPIHVLEQLPAETKERLLVVHTTADKISAESGLQIAPTGGLDDTIRVEVTADRGKNSRMMRYLMAMAAVDHFRGLPTNKAVEFLDIVREVHFEPRQDIIRLSEQGNHFYMILSGKCAIFAGEVARKVFVMYDYFGETSLVCGTPRTADVRALTHTTLLAIGKDDFLNFIAGTTIPGRMQRLFNNRVHRTWSLMDENPLLNSLNSAQRNELQSFMIHRRLAPGDHILEEGGEHQSVLVASGCVEQWSSSAPTPIAHQRASLVTDVGAVMENHPSAYHLRVREGGNFFLLPQREMRMFLNNFPGLYLRLMYPPR